MFIRLTRASDKTPVWISVNHIVAVYTYYKKGTTVVDYGSMDEDGFFEVAESVDQVMEIIKRCVDYMTWNDCCSTAIARIEDER